MLSQNDFIKQSLALHLFFARVMMEHAFFLEAGFGMKEWNLINQAEFHRKAFESLLMDVVNLANGVVSSPVLESGEVVTDYTMKAEMVSSNLTGTPINIGITRAEANLTPGDTVQNGALEEAVRRLNANAILLLKSMIQFKSSVLSAVLSCNLFSNHYPLLIDHILREARFYLELLQRIQNREAMDVEREAFQQEAFWNQIMADHSKFIRGLLDPTEVDLFDIANSFGTQFDQLTAEVKEAMDGTMPLGDVSANSLEATTQLRDFKAQAAEGLLGCSIRSMIIPLLSDHVLREANHYLRLLRMFEGALPEG
jgi:hypothetical protein